MIGRNKCAERGRVSLFGYHLTIQEFTRGVEAFMYVTCGRKINRAWSVTAAKDLFNNFGFYNFHHLCILAHSYSYSPIIFGFVHDVVPILGLGILFNFRLLT